MLLHKLIYIAIVLIRLKSNIGLNIDSDCNTEYIYSHYRYDHLQQTHALTNSNCI